MNEIEKKLWEKSRKYVKVLQVVPFLRMVAVCNNLAFGVVNEKSDIDLFIIARSGRLFTVRIFVTLILHVLGVRRHGNKVFGRFCLSFFTDEDGLEMDRIAIDNDIYLAYWIKSMVPLINDGCSLSFVEKNLWAKDYFENEENYFIRSHEILKVSKFYATLKRFFGWILGGFFGNFVEKILKSWQVGRASKKAEKLGDEASVMVTEHILKFHNVDRRRYYRDMWVEKYQTEKLTDEKFNQLCS